MIRILLGALIVIGTVAAVVFAARDLPPPRTVTFAAGSVGGGYWRIAQLYRAELARFDIEVTVLETAGSVENARLLASGEADVAFIQGGVETSQAEDAVPVETLAVVFPEPVFIFARAGEEPSSNPAAWRGLTVAAGGEGSGARAAWREFERAALIDPGANATAPLGGSEAAQALLDGEVDLVFYVAPLEAPYLQALFDSGEATVLALDHIEAIYRRLPESSLLTVPAGAVSMLPARPEAAMPMLAMRARLMAAQPLHPALVNRFVTAATRFHEGRTLIYDDGAFPTLEGAAPPVNAAARDLIINGPSPLGRFVPWWIAAQVNRVILLLLPLAVLIIPLVRAAPAIYAWRMRTRVHKLYERIRALDADLRDAAGEEALRDVNDRLGALDDDLSALKLPLPYGDYVYTARLQLDVVRKRARDRLAG